MQPDPDPTSTVIGMAYWGWMSPSELEWLRARASEMQSVVEIGCLHGRSSAALATGCDGPVWCIDPWSDDGWTSWKASIGDVFDNVTGIRAPSPQAGAQVPVDPDMVFIDGAHDFESVYADVAYWRERTKVLLCGHDYVSAVDLGENEAAFPDVKRAVDELLGEENIQIAEGTAIWMFSINGR